MHIMSTCLFHDDVSAIRKPYRAFLETQSNGSHSKKQAVVTPSKRMFAINSMDSLLLTDLNMVQKKVSRTRAVRLTGKKFKVIWGYRGLNLAVGANI